MLFLPWNKITLINGNIIEGRDIGSVSGTYIHIIDNEGIEHKISYENIKYYEPSQKLIT